MATFLLIGAYGAAGREMASLLLRATSADLVLAGRSLAKAQALAAELGLAHPGRVRAAQADAGRPDSLSNALHGVDLLLDLTSAPDLAAQLARTALHVGADFLDIHFQGKVFRQLAPLGQDFENAGRLLLTQCGCHPGLPAALIRVAARRFDKLERASVGMGMHLRVENETTALELVDAMTEEDASLVYGQGAWRTPAGSGQRAFDLGPRFGWRPCYPMFLEELRALPHMFGIDELGLYAAGFNPVVDYCLLPLIMLCGKFRLRWTRPVLARLFTWGVNAFARQRPGMSFLLEAQGQRQGQAATLRLLVDSDSPYALTALPVVACLRQYLAQGLPRSGLWCMGQAVDPDLLLDDMAALGATITWDWRPA